MDTNKERRLGRETGVLQLEINYNKIEGIRRR